MTNFEHYTADIETLSKLLADATYGRRDDWSEQFNKEVCSKCTPEHVKYVEMYDMSGKLIKTFKDGEQGSEDDIYPCDETNGICPHGDDIVWWLNKEYKDMEAK